MKYILIQCIDSFLSLRAHFHLCHKIKTFWTDVQGEITIQWYITLPNYLAANVSRAVSDILYSDYINLKSISL